MGYDEHQAFIDELFAFLWKKRMYYWDEHERKLKEYIQSQGHPGSGLPKQKPSISEYDLKANVFLRLFLHIRDFLYMKDDPQYLEAPYPMPVITEELRRCSGEIKSIFAKHGEETPPALGKIE